MFANYYFFVGGGDGGTEEDLKNNCMLWYNILHCAPDIVTDRLNWSRSRFNENLIFFCLNSLVQTKVSGFHYF